MVGPGSDLHIASHPTGSSTLELTTQPAADGDGHKQLLKALEELADVQRVEHLHDGDAPELRARLYVSGEAAQLVAPAATLLAQRGLTLSGVEIGAPSLEDVFIHLTGAVAAMSAVAAAAAEPRVSQSRAFVAVLRRDLFVTWSELPVFLAQVILQPLFLLFVFGKVLSALGYTRPGYTELLFPGLLALTAVITGLQTLAFPLVVEFGWTKEIEDRLLAPMATRLVAAEKVLFATFRAVVATTLMIPIASGSACWCWAGSLAVLMTLGMRGFFRRAID